MIKKMNNKGYMLVEVVVASCIAFVMVYFLMDITINMVNKNNDYYEESVLVSDKNIITKTIMDDLRDNAKKLTSVNVDPTGSSVTFTFKDDKSKKLSYIKREKDGKTIKEIAYGNDDDGYYKKELADELNVGEFCVKANTSPDCVTSVDANVKLIYISLPAYTNYSDVNYGLDLVVSLVN